jgi:sugar phosphate isomerase/epimerase
MPGPDGLGFQLYSAREFPPLEARMRLLANLGYTHVEPYGALLEHGAEVKAALAATGLKAPTSHVALDRLRRDLEGAVAELKALGVEVAIIPYLTADARPSNAAGWRQLGQEVAGLGRSLAVKGLGLAWHNHDFEMVALGDGSRPMDLLLESAPELGWEADIAWIVRGGQDPAAWLGRHADRIVALHVKDVSAEAGGPEEGWADVGHGVLDWKHLVPVMRATRARWWIVEHDRPSDADRFARNSMATFKGWEAGR